METQKVAILIDADNANSALIEQILNEVGKYGRITVKRIYGDWTTQRNNKWKNVLNTYAIRPIQKFAYANAKNSSDIALVIDAMDLLHSKIVDSFCIVSSDSDYTGLAHRIREEGLNIIGIGKEHTPEAFKKACITFIWEENLENNNETKFNNVKLPSNKKVINYDLIQKAFNMVQNDSGMALFSKFSEALRKIDPEFDYRSYGFNNFTNFCKSLSGYEIFTHQDKTTYSLKVK
ncbi:MULTISPECIES: NYN domain-containing protein [Glaesserella]|uniref:Maebl n=1 Tax=Glaesserella australis TaxID=2094024 RepID=A0A328C3I0_9PAST|nr:MULTISPECIES: NYN domain-containing protein [Glaesserella]AUI65639.1 Maebl [Glaesserella sp. 15-184]RAL19074.1 Maebl [Glaesserella australis]